MDQFNEDDPWELKVEGTGKDKRYYFALDGDLHTPIPEVDHYAWGIMRKPDGHGNISHFGFFLKLKTWKGLLRKKNTNKPVKATHNGLDINGKEIKVDLSIISLNHDKSEGQILHKKPPTGNQVNDWFNEGQKNVEGVAQKVAKSPTRWYQVNNTSLEGHTDFITTFTLNNPAYAYYAPNQLYVKLRNDNFKSLGTGSGSFSPEAAYISEHAFSLLRGIGKNGTQHGHVSLYPWPGGDTRALVIRSETGELCDVDCGMGTKLAVCKTWETYWDRATKDLDSGGWSRTINPNIELKIVMNGTKRITREEMVCIFSDAQKKGAVQRFCIYDHEEWSNDLSRNHKLLSKSPFGDYYTWLPEHDWITYLQVRADRKFPKIEKDINDANEALPNLQYTDQVGRVTAEVTKSSITNNVTASKIQNAKKVDRNKITQSKVMGGSAGGVAGAFGWDDPSEIMTDGTDIWPATKLYPAEWLHRSAYSWGGLAGVGGTSALTSQVPDNLIFGTSECNTLMMRYESSWQRLFLKEDDLRRKHPSQGLENLSGLLRSDIRSAKTFINTSKFPYQMKQTWGPKTLDKWFDKAPWLCFAMEYELRLLAKSRILGDAEKFSTEFYPFQRGFFTKLEAIADQLLLEHWEKRASASMSTPQGTKMFLAIERNAELSVGVEDDNITNVVEEPHIATMPASPTSLVPPNSTHLDRGTVLSSLVSIDAQSTSNNAPVDTGTIPDSATIQSDPLNNLNDGDDTAFHNAVWSAVLSGRSQIQIDGITLHNPRLITIDVSGNLIEAYSGRIGLNELGEWHMRPATQMDTEGGPNRPSPDSEEGKAEVVLGDESTNDIGAIPNEGETGQLHLDGVPQERGHQLDTQEIQPSPQTTKAPDHYTVKADFQLFGTVDATLSISRGSSGIKERVELKNSLSLGTLIPDLQESPINAIALQNTSLTYNSQFHGQKSPGVTCHTDVVLSGFLQPVSDSMKEVFGMEHPSISVSGFLGWSRDWKTPMVLCDFTLRAAFKKLEINIGEVLEITELGVDLNATRFIKQEDTITTGYDYGYGFFGKALVKLQKSLPPLKVQWYLSKMDSTYNMTLTIQDDEWKDVMGIKGLVLSNVQFGACFNSGHVLDTIDLSIRATLELKSGIIALDGSYSKSNWEIGGYVQNITLSVLEEMYEHMFGTQLSQVSAQHDITFTTLQLKIGSSGIFFEGDVTVNEHTSASATIQISSAGVEIKGSVNDVQLNDRFKIEEASLDVFIGAANASGRPSQVSITGTVAINSDIKVVVGLFMDKQAGTGTQWTVYGEYEKDLKLSGLASPLSGTFLDKDLTKIAFIASNQDQPSQQISNQFRYQVKKGFQVCATIDEIQAVKDVTRTNASDLVISVAYDLGESVKIFLMLPTNNTIILTSDIQSGPVTFEIIVSPDPSIAISGSLNVTVPKQSDGLVLGLKLDAGIYQASCKATMQGEWRNPLGISQQLAIENVLVEATIIYEEFFTTGIPKDLKLGGTLFVGETEGTVLLEISEVPSKELIFVKVTDLDLSNLVSFVCKVMNANITAPSDNTLLNMKEIFLYLSTGVMINGRSYPAGIQFDCDMDVFGHNAKISGALGQEIKFNGTVDPFSLGDLVISGDKDTKPSIEVDLSSTTHSLEIDGAARLNEFDAKIHVVANTTPSIVFSFHTNITFDELEFKLDATMLEGMQSKDTKSLDFKLDATLGEEVLKHITSKGNTHFKAIYDTTKAKNDAAADVTQKKDSLTHDQEVATAKLNVATANWNEKSQLVHAAFDSKQAEVITSRKKQSDELSAAKREYNKLITKLTSDLETGKAELGQAVKEAELAVSMGAKSAEKKMEEWNRELGEREKEFYTAFGSMDQHILEAQEEVNKHYSWVTSKESQISALQVQIENAGFFERMGLGWNIIELEVEKNALEAELWLAQKTLAGAKAVIDSVAYTDAKYLFDKAQMALVEGVEFVKTDSKRLEDALQKANAFQAEEIDKATKALEIAKVSGAIPEAVVIAIKAVEDFETRVKDEITSVQKDIDGLATSAEHAAVKEAKKALAEIDADIKALGPALSGAEGWEAKAEKVIGGLIKDAENIVEVKEVTLFGQLGAMMSQTTKVLIAKIVVDVAKVEQKFELFYTIGDTESFFDDLWKNVWTLL